MHGWVPGYLEGDNLLCLDTSNFVCLSIFYLFKICAPDVIKDRHMLKTQGLV